MEIAAVDFFRKIVENFQLFFEILEKPLKILNFNIFNEFLILMIIKV